MLKNYTFEGTLRLKKGRYYWSVKLPGQKKFKTIALRQSLDVPATKVEGHAKQLAQRLWEEAVMAAANPSAIRTVGQLHDIYLKHIDQAYKSKSDMPQRVRYAFACFDEKTLDGSIQEFGPRKLLEIRNRMIFQPDKEPESRREMSVTIINERVNFIIQMFEWGVTQQYLGPEIPYALRLIKAIKGNAAGVKPSKKQRPVALDVVIKTLPQMSPVLQAMTKVQLYTGMRPSEMLIMRTCDIDMTKWLYYPGGIPDPQHKTAHLGSGYEREVAIGKAAQEILLPFIMNRRQDDYLFKPSETVAEHYRVLNLNRTTPAGYGNKPGTNKKGTRCDGDHYTEDTYRRAVERACDRAFPLPEQLGPAEGESLIAWRRRLTADQKKQVTQFRKEHRWTPYQLRHAAATYVRSKFGDSGLSVVQAFLGQKSFGVAERYAQVNRSLMKEAVDAIDKIEL